MFEFCIIFYVCLFSRIIDFKNWLVKEKLFYFNSEISNLVSATNYVKNR